jgi:hypothetical protein
MILDFQYAPNGLRIGDNILLYLNSSTPQLISGNMLSDENVELISSSLIKNSQQIAIVKILKRKQYIIRPMVSLKLRYIFIYLNFYMYNTLHMCNIIYTI